MYDRTIPVFTRGLRAMSGILTKAEAHCAARRIDPAVLINYRLYPDMLAFARQIQIATDYTRRCAARLAGVEPLSMPDNEATFPELRDRIGRTLEHLETFTPAHLDGSGSRTVSFRAGGQDISMTGADYVSYYALPNFYFHLTTAHCILRHNGVEIGKSDFLGV